MPTLCPSCTSPIPHPDINVQSDTALCRRCGLNTSYSSLIHAPTAGLYTAPPDGCHVERIGDRWRATASTRSWACIPLLLFAAFWNSMVGLFAFAILRKGLSPCILFLSLHIAAGILVLVQGLCAAIGDVEVAESSGIIEVSTGIGPIRWKRRRIFADIARIREETSARRRTTSTYLILDGPDPIKFGTQLPTKRRYFLHAAIAAHLAERPHLALP